MNITYLYSLQEACLKGSKYWTNYFIKKGEDCWQGGLEGACEGGHLDLVYLMIEKGVKYWDYGLEGAC